MQIIVPLGLLFVGQAIGSAVAKNANGGKNIAGSSTSDLNEADSNRFERPDLQLSPGTKQGSTLLEYLLTTNRGGSGLRRTRSLGHSSDIADLIHAVDQVLDSEHTNEGLPHPRVQRDVSNLTPGFFPNPQSMYDPSSPYGPAAAGQAFR